MKKALYSTIVLCLMTASAQAQVTKGSVLLGGGINFGGTKTDNSDLNEQHIVFITPAAGIAVKENLVIGVEAVYGKTELTYNTPVYENDEKRLGGTLFLRKYYPLGKGFLVYEQGNLSYLNQDATAISPTDSRTETSSNTVSVSIAPGLAYALSKKFHLELGFNNMVGLSYGKSEISNTNFGSQTTFKSKSFGVTTALSTAAPLNLGFRFFLSR